MIRLVEYWNRRREPTWLLGFVSFRFSPPHLPPPPFSFPTISSSPPPSTPSSTPTTPSLFNHPTHRPPPLLPITKAAAHDMGFSYLILMRGCKGIGGGDVLGRWDMCWIYGGRRGLIHEVGEGAGGGKTTRQSCKWIKRNAPPSVHRKVHTHKMLLSLLSLSLSLSPPNPHLYSVPPKPKNQSQQKRNPNLTHLRYSFTHLHIT